MKTSTTGLGRHECVMGRGGLCPLGLRPHPRSLPCKMKGGGPRGAAWVFILPNKLPPEASGAGRPAQGLAGQRMLRIELSRRCFV
jgi:hypothetical protein